MCVGVCIVVHKYLSTYLIVSMPKPACAHVFNECVFVFALPLLHIYESVNLLLRVWVYVHVCVRAVV